MTNMKTGESAGSRFIGAGSNSHGCPPSPERRAGDLVPTPQAEEEEDGRTKNEVERRTKNGYWRGEVS
jgi:Cu/Zn superoxide dismutase